MIKKYEDLRYTDDFMFGKVMRVPSICKAVLELLLEVPIERIEYVETQKTLDVSSRSKGVRLDAYVKGSEGTLYNVEMQAARKWNLQKRSRYYQGVLDMSQLEKGMDYETLPQSFIIFLCAFDLFGKGRCRYTFVNTCKEDPDVCLEDGTAKVFVNATCERDGLSEEMCNFLDYVCGMEPRDELTAQIEQIVIQARSNEKWRAEYMKLEADRMDWKREGHAEGFTEGREEGFTEGREEGFTEGRAEGRTEGSLETAQKLYALFQTNALTEERFAEVMKEAAQL